MKQKHLLTLLQTGIRTLSVVFDQSDTRAPMPASSSKRGLSGDFGGMNMGSAVPPWAAERSDARRAFADHMSSYRPDLKRYTYKTRDDKVTAGDLVVVDTSTRGMVIARVVMVHETVQIDVDADFDYKWVVQRIDRDAYDAQLVADAAAADMLLQVERERQREELLDHYHKTLPEGSAARRLFDSAVSALNPAPVVVPAAPADQAGS